MGRRRQPRLFGWLDSQGRMHQEGMMSGEGGNIPQIEKSRTLGMDGEWLALEAKRPS